MGSAAALAARHIAAASDILIALIRMALRCASDRDHPLIWINHTTSRNRRKSLQSKRRRETGAADTNRNGRYRCGRATKATEEKPRNAVPAGESNYSFMMSSTIFLMSASGTAGLGGIGIGPHTPEPPFFTFSESLATASA